ncbi:Calcium/calmodulin-dependent 3',5'-cyclic nucleotide phosphodiesterase 1B, partial [Perkinsus olseni]
LLEHTVRKLNNSEAGGGPTTNYEKAFADIGSALELLEGFSGGSVVQSAEFFDSVSRGFRSSDVVELHSLTRDTQYKEQIIGATTLIRESVKILSRRTSIDKVVFRDTPSTRREARRDFIEYMNHILNQNSTPNQLNKEWTLMTGGKVTLNATSSNMGDITAKAYGMLQTAGQDYNLNLIELQDSVLPNMPILQFIATQLASVLAFGALRIEWDILNNFLSRVSGTYTEVEYHNQMHAAQ